ncbi:uncharacterized protein LOC131044751 isoform X2 [Cryptomeria japonica]|uniref:uncharacterized protein LOC131044751 isoform X2 n=1 Tax=Cryptomeria japonica TaxID=3369 RepID=UPI0027DA5E60|nr:uncharacterized protein LOC131044751 isoform X2 [Cryptomeria japonica]
MCILCVTSRLSRRIVIMLTWLVIPLISLWAFSQFLPPSLRFEITSSRLACILVLLISIGWYEVIFPWLCAWRAHRNSLMKERGRVESQMAAKWRREAIRKCRNCLTAYRDQNPGSGRFMCGYCGHISRRPILEITKLDPGISGSGNMENYCGSSMGTFRGILQGGKCPSGESCSDLAMFIVKSVEFSMFIVGWFWKIMQKKNFLREHEILNSGSKADKQTSEDRCDFHVKKVEKAKRKAEEKRQARLVKEMVEEEERKQREEVARLVEERSKLRNQKLEVEKEFEREAVTVREQEIDREKEIGRRPQAVKNRKTKVSAKGNLVEDGEVLKNKKESIKEKIKLEENEETGKKILESTSWSVAEPMKNVKNSKTLHLTLQKGFKTNGQARKGAINGTAQVDTSQYSAPAKYYIISHGRSASYSSPVTRVCGEKSGVKPGKINSSLDASSNENGSAGSISLNRGQVNNSVWNRTACSNIWNKGTHLRPEVTCNNKTFLTGSKECGDFKAVKHVNGCMDRITPLESHVGVELQMISQVTTHSKSWENLCTRPSTSSCMSHNSALESKFKEEKPIEISSNSFAMQVPLSSSPSTSISFGSFEHTSPTLAAATSKCSDLVSCGVISPDSQVSPVRLVTVGSITYKDSLYQQDAISLLGPVTESVISYSAAVGSSPSDTKATGIQSSGCSPISAPSHRPVHIPSPVSRALSTETNCSFHCNGDQISCVTDLWSLPSIFSDVSNESYENINRHMREVPKVGHSTLDKSSRFLPAQNMPNEKRCLIQPFSDSISQSYTELENHIPSCILPLLENDNSNQENGDVNFCPNQPSFQCTVEDCNELDSQLFPPNFVNCIKKGATENSLNDVEENNLTIFFSLTWI